MYIYLHSSRPPLQNDIANSIAPVAAIIDIYQSGTLNPEAPVQKWILAYGGVALALGLLLYGYKVMKTIGYKLTALSPTRGSSASLASSLMVATASYVGIPVSTTQCIVGAVAGIGLGEISLSNLISHFEISFLTLKFHFSLASGRT